MELYLYSQYAFIAYTVTILTAS